MNRRNLFKPLSPELDAMMVSTGDINVVEEKSSCRVKQKKTALMRQNNAIKVMAHAIAVAFGSAIFAVGMTTSAFAQSNATGTIFGQVPNINGVTVVLENTATGVSRIVTPDGKGKFQATSMPPGRYQVKLLRNGSLEKSIEVESLVGQGVEASFQPDPTMQTVTVAAKINKIDVSNTNVGTVFTSRELAKLPISQNVQAIITMAPGTVKDVTGKFGNVSRFSGASASENAYYINGFPVTSVLTQIGASELPFGAIANAQILSGGYSSEFGRSTGGVVNITTKSGTNDWQVGAKLSLVPSSFSARQSNTYYPNTGARPDTDGKLQFYNQDNTSNSKTLGVYAGGPLIKNKLFIFTALEQTRASSEGISASSDTAYNASGWGANKTTTGRYLVKLDYNLTDDHHFEYTHIVDEAKSVSSSYGFNYTSLTHDDVKRNGTTSWNSGSLRGVSSGGNPGGTNGIFKYTGYLTDDLTVTALYGKSHTSPRVVPYGFDPRIASVSSTSDTKVRGLIYPNNPQPFGAQIRPDSKDEQQTYRFDVEYKLGAHSLRAGIDYNKAASLLGYSLPGGSSWAYLVNKSPDYKPAFANQTLRQGGGYGTDGYYVAQYTEVKSGAPTTTQSAQYIQDRYQVTDNILLDLGLRNEQFSNYNNAGQLVISQKSQIAPRLGATWDVNGDGSFKAYANLGRYYMPVPTSLVANMGSLLKRTTQYFTYTGVDGTTGLPQGLHPISDVIINLSSNPDARSVAAENIKPYYQDEMSLGFEKAISPKLNFGLMATYRVLRSNYEDTCDTRPIAAWGVRNNVNLDKAIYPSYCMVINGGIDNDVWINPDPSKPNSQLMKIHLTAADLGFPKVNRTYSALNFFLEHPFSQGWYAKVNYTFSRLRGNTEGQVQDGDVALSSVDFPEQLINGTGLLAANRTHVIKAYGFYEITPQITMGANIQLASGRPRTCMGKLPTTAGVDFGGYSGSNFFFCNVDANGHYIEQGTPSPRASGGRLPWTTQIDLNLSYQPQWMKGLNLKLDMFNVLDRRTINTINDSSNNDTGLLPTTYGQGGNLMSPRSARLTAEYNYKF
jgi:outer membrane receptor protein involved in Fe transport